jgi:hypothetical protein
MPGILQYFGIDPNKKQRGSGYYYMRGHGVWSKYSPLRDAKIQARGYKINKIGVNKKGKRSAKAQSGDGILPW